MRVLKSAITRLLGIKINQLTDFAFGCDLPDKVLIGRFDVLVMTRRQKYSSPRLSYLNYSVNKERAPKRRVENVGPGLVKVGGPQNLQRDTEPQNSSHSSVFRV